MKIAIMQNNPYVAEKFRDFVGDQYVIDLDRRSENVEKDDIICHCTPFRGMPLCLEIAIRGNGEIIFRNWKFVETENYYLQTAYGRTGDKDALFTCEPTKAQCETVAGLFSGRIRFEGLRLAPGRSLQHLCPINIDEEEKKNEEKLYLA